MKTRLVNVAENNRIRSFVLRQGRITPAQARAFALHWARYGIEVQGKSRDLNEIFKRTAPLVLEIGFGNGAALCHAALLEPNKNFIGVEVHRPGVGRLLNALASDDLDNVRIFHEDAVEILTTEIEPQSLSEVRIYFPDPWPKKRHHKRRLIQSEFTSLIASRMKAGGLLHLATDWAEYASHMCSVLDASREWKNLAEPGPFSARPPWRIETHFERRGMRLGHQVWDLIYAKS